MGKKNKNKKKNNPYGGKKGSKKNNPYGGKKGSLKVNPANYQSKAAKQAFISNIVRDGRVSQNEARNAASLGIGRKRIQRGYDKSFRPGNPFSTARVEGGNPLFSISSGAKGPPGLYSPKAKTPTPYSPLIIGNKADAALGSAAFTPAPAPPPPPPAPVVEDPIEPIYEAPIEPEYDPFADFMMNTFPSLLQTLTAPMMQPEPVYEPLPPPVTYASVGQAAQSAPGVQARRSSASQSMASTLGTRGSFNRGGVRISNLNI